MRVLFLALVWLHVCLRHQVEGSNTTGVLSIPPSLYWDGADGSWSTFFVQVGTPPQAVRLLPGTSANAGDSTWVVHPIGCSAQLNANLTNCAWERGSIFESNESTTWSTQRLTNGGLYGLDLYEESPLGMTGNAYYGFDTLSLGVAGAGMPTLSNQVIASFADNSFWLGSLGLSPIPCNFSNINDPVPSMLSTLRNQNYIASTSWAYTAGASYKDPPVFGSLILGGYDLTRYNSTSSLDAVPFGADFSRDLLVGLHSITYDTLGSAPLLSNGIYAFIDSMVAAMWLPIPVCQAFEQAFNLTWNATAELYLLTDDQHASLVAQNPTFSFSLSPQASAGGRTVDIVFPYSAFDLNITQPYVAESMRYFPLKRAQNESQYTLGRAFLQEAHVIADYDRREFSVAQALFPATGIAQDLQVLEPPNGAAQSSNGTTQSPNGAGTFHLSAGAIAGVVIGASIVLVLCAMSVLLCIKRRKGTTAIPDTPEDKSDPVPELSPDGTNPFTEMAVDGSAIHEMGDQKAILSELGGQKNFVSELTSPAPRLPHELEAESCAHEKWGVGIVTMPVELEAPWEGRR